MNYNLFDERKDYDTLNEREYENSFAIEKKILEPALNPLELSDLVRVIITSDNLILKQEKEEIDQEIKIKREILKEFNHEGVGTLTQYSVRYLYFVKDLISLLNPKDLIRISLNFEEPIKIEFEIKRLSCKITIFIAPRVD